MANIIAGEFATIAETETVADALTSADFDATDSAVFMLNAPGQHVIYPIGGDEDAAPGARQAHTGAVSGAKQVESAEGRLENGKWLDFDPLAAPHIVNSDAPAHARQSGDGAVR